MKIKSGNAPDFMIIFLCYNIKLIFKKGGIFMSYDFNTKNKSFIEMHNYLKEKDIINNKFFLYIKNKNLIGVDPYDPNLTSKQKREILKECMDNYWYFIREVIRIPTGDGLKDPGSYYKLNRANLAFNFCASINTNILYETSTQQGKTTAIISRLLWEYCFGSTDNHTALLDETYDNGRLKLQKIKHLKNLLPKYMINKDVIDNLSILRHSFFNNEIMVSPPPSNKIKANDIGQKITHPRIYFDNWAFVNYNNIIYSSLKPIFTEHSTIAKKNGNPYGIIIATTTSKLNNEHAIFAYQMEQEAIPFSELFYDMKINHIKKLIKNNISDFILIKYKYYELGLDEKWFKEQCKLLLNDHEVIKHEILLEWD